MHYYQHHIGDFIKSTANLTHEERSIYLQLIWKYYDSEKPLPDDVESLAFDVGARDKEPTIRSLLKRFFVYDNDMKSYKHERIDAEISKYHAKSDRAKSALASRWSKNDMKSGIKSDMKSYADQIPTIKPITNNHKPINNTPSDEVVPESKKLAVIVNEDDLRLARFFYQKVLIVQPKAKEPNFEKWANTIRLVREQDGRTHKQIQDVFLWANKDPFWKANIMSPEALRKQLDKLEVQMQNKPTGASNSGSLADRMAAETYRHLLPQEGSFNDEPKLIG